MKLVFLSLVLSLGAFASLEVDTYNNAEKKFETAKPVKYEDVRTDQNLISPRCVEKEIYGSRESYALYEDMGDMELVKDPILASPYVKFHLQRMPGEERLMEQPSGEMADANVDFKTELILRKIPEPDEKKILFIAHYTSDNEYKRSQYCWWESDGI